MTSCLTKHFSLLWRSWDC